MRCSCTDPACTVGHGASGCEQQPTHTVYRIDVTDINGTDQCVHCATDAVDSGVFRAEDLPVPNMTQWDRRSERSREDHTVRRTKLIEAADKLAEACARLDLGDQMMRLDQYLICRADYRLDYERTSSKTEEAP